MSQYYAKLNREHYVTPFAENVLIAERDEVQRVAEAHEAVNVRLNLEDLGQQVPRLTPQPQTP